MSVPEALLHARERRITAEEYHHAIREAGIFSEKDRIEWLDGHLVAMPPIGPMHSHCVSDLTDLFNRRLYSFDHLPARVSVQNPIQLGEYGKPQPHLIVLSERERAVKHPPLGG
ncbi:Uma2 family endonuclease [Salinibacter ruber]|uniref:Uma2 family endonuclease n=1 Tax=Salinibacter ruber TaxID=146919 RepID=UPI003C6DF680